MTSVAGQYQAMPLAAGRPTFGSSATQSCSYTKSSLSHQQAPWTAQQQAPTISRDPGMQHAFRARLQNSSCSQLHQDAAAMQFEEEGSGSFAATYQRSSWEQQQQQQTAAASSFWASSGQQQQQQSQLPPHPIHAQNRRTSFEVHAAASQRKRTSMDVSPAALAAAAASRRSTDASTPVSRRSMEASAVARRRTAEVGNAVWTRSSLFSSSAAALSSGSSRCTVAAATTAAAAAAVDRRCSLDGAAAPDRRGVAAARYSIDVCSAAYARSSLYGRSAAALGLSGMAAMPGSRPMRSSPWGRDGLPAAAPMTAHGVHAAALQARSGSSAQAAQQQELHQRAALSCGQQQSLTSYTAVSAFAAAAAEAPLVRTNSGGSSGSAGSSSSTYAGNRQQQQLMQMAMHSELFAGRDAHATAAARLGAAADAVQQHQQHTSALQVIEEEIRHLLKLGQQLLATSKAAPQGSAAAAACEAAIVKHEAAMGQALQARAALEAAAEQALRGLGSMDMDAMEMQGYYEAADACAAGTGTGTESEEEEYCSYEGHAPMVRSAQQQQQNCAMSLSSVSMTEASSYQQQGVSAGRDAGLSREQQQQHMVAAAQQQKMLQLRALQQMSADLHVMQSELAMLKMLPTARQQ